MAINALSKLAQIARLDQLKKTSFNKRHLGIAIAEGELQGVTRGAVTGKLDTASAGDVIQDEGGPIVIETTATIIEMISDDAEDISTGDGAKAVIAYGVDINWNPIVEIIQMNGLTVTLPSEKEFLYVWTAQIVDSGPKKNIGNILIRKESAGATMCMITAEYGNSHKAMFPVFAGCDLYLEDLRLEGTKTGILTGQVNLMVYEMDEGIRVSHPLVFKEGEGKYIKWTEGVKHFGPKSLIWLEVEDVSELSILTASMTGVLVRNADSTPA